MAKESKDESGAMRMAAQFLESGKAVVADASAASRGGIGKTLVEMGVKTSDLTLTTDYALAADCIRDMRPRVVVADYDLGAKCGIDLVHLMREAGIAASESLFIIVTGNASQSAVAEAAEEEVDAYLLKPYTLTQFKHQVAAAAAAKLAPSPYLAKIIDGKKLLAENRLQPAIELFSAAIRLEPKASLACYYKGVAELELKLLDEAQKSFDLGLMSNPIHYKCLTGQFDLFSVRSKFAEAYGIARKIAAHFPLSPDRLCQTIKLSVVTGNFADLADLYDLYKALDTRGASLTKYICAGLAVGARFYFKAADKEKGLDYVRKASVTAGGAPMVLRDLLLTLVEFKELGEAEKLLKRFPSANREGAEYRVAKLAFDDATLGDARTMVHQARAAIEDGLEEPVAYEILIKRYLQIQKPDLAQEWMEKALRLWPGQKDRFQPA